MVRRKNPKRKKNKKSRMVLTNCKLAAGPFDPLERRCDWCGEELTGLRRRWCSDEHSSAWFNNHEYTRSRLFVIERDGGKCRRCGEKKPIEVNHIRPCKGKHSIAGCWHHQDNLESLCKSCHRQVTRAQRHGYQGSGENLSPFWGIVHPELPCGVCHELVEEHTFKMAIRCGLEV